MSSQPEPRPLPHVPDAHAIPPHPTVPTVPTEKIMSNPTEPIPTEAFDSAPFTPEPIPTEPFPTSHPGMPDVLKHLESEGQTVRVGTIVWGAVVIALGILVILIRQAGLQLDAGETAMWLLFGAGLAMVAGGTVNLLRKKQTQR